LIHFYKRMPIKQKLFVRFFHESNLDLPMICDRFPSEGVPRGPIYQSQPLGYIKRKTVVPLLRSNRILHNRFNLNRKACKLMSLNSEESSLQDQVIDNFPQESFKPDYFSFLEKRLNHKNVMSEKPKDGILDAKDQDSLFVGDKILTSQSSVDFLSWLEDKLEKNSSDSNGGDKSFEERTESSCKFKCKFCGKIYTTKNGLDYHIVLHKGIYPFKCGHCNKRFKSSSTMHRHVNCVHKRLKPLKCKECAKSFHQKSNLRKHLDSHYGIRKFKCYICSKAFFQNAHLKNHLATHTGIKQFSCTICNQKFAKQYCLDRHTRVVHFCGLC